ncbi:hypothetical protein NEOKW01_1893 [Nematocida sp. AWRm80]|nr:hypothetical protein NEOKW01_1893 [Nematocida sp. AWRm80]
MTTDIEEETLTDSKCIEISVASTIDSFEKLPKTIDELLLKIKKDIKIFFTHYLNKSNPIIKDEAFRKNIIAYKNGIICAIEISEDTKEKYNSLATSLVDNIPIEMSNEKQELAGILQEEINNQLSDIILGFSDVRDKLKDKKDAMKRFKYLATVCNESNEIVKAFLINSLQPALDYISHNDIQGIDYKNIDDIKELPQEVLEK